MHALRILTNLGSIRKKILTMAQNSKNKLHKLLVFVTLIIPHKNTLIEIEPHLFLTKTANWGSNILKVSLVYMYDVNLVQFLKILNSTAVIN